jgi:type II secretory pathway component GspD/PulD (secretin)
VNTARFLAMTACCLLCGCSESSREKKWATDPAASDPKATTFSSLDKPSAKTRKILPTGAINLDNADTDAVFKLYQSLSGRTVVRSATLPTYKITLRTEQPVTVQKALQMLDTALAQNGIVMIPQGSDMVKAVTPSAAGTEAVPICQLAPEELPESSSYTHYVVHLKSRKPRDLAQALQPFAKMPTSIVAIDADQTIILRDYAVNVRRMLQVIEDLEANRPPRPLFADLIGTNNNTSKSGRSK